ncbi:MAG: hypothetical protein ACC628_06895 [Pirellulaceae bacterium]
MHGHVTEAEFLAGISGLLGCYYLALALMNVGAALHGWSVRRSGARNARQPRWRAENPYLWLLVALLFIVLASISLGRFAATPRGADLLPLADETAASLGRLTAPAESLLTLPGALRRFLDRLMGPLVFCAGTMIGLSGMFWFRTFFVKPVVAWSLLNVSLLAMGLSITDPDFARIVTKPDNVAIVSMVFLLGFFTWLSACKAVQNDERLARGEEPLESLDREKVLVWPDLVYIELICMVALTALLIVWAIVLKAPLEEPASVVNTPNPSKAPWYFVGLQEMLYYFEPWMAGVVLPSLIIFGLMAIPYLDCNEQGNGYYTIHQRKFAYLVFQFGFLVLWITLILLGTFMRGPNWTFFGFYEAWDVHKVQPQTNINLSRYVWVEWLGAGLPQAPEGAGAVRRFATAFWRELPGIFFLTLYFAALPSGLAVWSKLFREMYAKMGFLRYVVMVLLLLTMVILPLKMVAVWTLALQYLVSFPEYGVNF